MYRTQCVFSLLLVYAGLAHSFDWEIVTRTTTLLQFYDKNGTLTHSQGIPASCSYNTLIYDPVHNRVLFADCLNNIFRFDIASKITESLVRKVKDFVTSFAYDPVSEILFWSDYKNMYSISLKPGLNNTVNEKQLILSEIVYDMDVDICGGLIYWISDQFNVQRARFDGSQRETVTVVNPLNTLSINIDQHAHKIYWYQPEDSYDWIKHADLNGEKTTKMYQIKNTRIFQRQRFTFSKDHIYRQICEESDIYRLNCSTWKIPKNALNDIDHIIITPSLFFESDDKNWGIAAKYNIEEVTRRVQNCGRLKSLLPKNSVSNVSSDESLLCVHGTKVSGESRCECTQGYSGERCDVSVCHTYCFHGNCGVSAEGEPKCRCNAGYSGARCKVNICQGYCLNDGVCSLNENKQPVCQCTGAKCEVNACQGYCQNGGVCSLNENRQPVCQCTAGYEGDRCDVKRETLADSDDFVHSKANEAWNSYKLICSVQVLVMTLLI